MPAASHANRRFCEQHLNVDPRVDAMTADLLSDPQTSGGLFVAVAPKDGEVLMQRLQEAGVSEAAIIGEVTGTGTGRIKILP